MTPVKSRDGFDELTTDMNHGKEEFGNTKGNINEGLTVSSNGEYDESIPAPAASIYSAVNVPSQPCYSSSSSSPGTYSSYPPTLSLTYVAPHTATHCKFEWCTPQ